MQVDVGGLELLALLEHRQVGVAAPALQDGGRDRDRAVLGVCTSTQSSQAASQVS